MEDNFLSVLYDVLIVFALGGSALLLISGGLQLAGFDFLWFRLKYAFDDGGYGVILIVLFGCFSIAFAIYDGQFVGKVKSSHWSKKRRD